MKYILIICVVFFSGCITTYEGVGSKLWLENQLLEIESSYENKEITKSEYLDLKIKANQVRSTLVARKKSSGNKSSFKTHWGADGSFQGYSY